MALKKNEQKLLKNFRGTIRQAERLINRKLTREEKTDLGLITVMTKPKFSTPDLDSLSLDRLFKLPRNKYNKRERQKYNYNKIKQIDNEILQLEKQLANEKNVFKRIELRKIISNLYQEQIKREERIYSVNKPKKSKKTEKIREVREVLIDQEARQMIQDERIERRQNIADPLLRIRRLFDERTENIDYDIELIRTMHTENFDATRYYYRINGTYDIMTINNVLQDLINRFNTHINERSLITLEVNVPTDQRGAHSTISRVLTPANLNYMWIAQNLFQVMDYHEIALNEIEFVLTVFTQGEGGGRTLKIINNKNSRSIIQIPDGMCLPRAIVTAIARKWQKAIGNLFKNKLTTVEIKEINYRRKGTLTELNDGIVSPVEIEQILKGDKFKLQKILAIAFCRIVGIELKDVHLFTDILKIEEALGIKVIVYDYGNKQVFNSKFASEFVIHLLHDGNHFNVLTHVTAAFADNTERIKCKRCNTKDIQHTGDFITCQTCNKYFQGDDCYQAHINNKFCSDKEWRCIYCKRTFNTKQRAQEDHKCGEMFCKNCKNWHLDGQDHKCYMIRKAIKPLSELYAFFDLEGWQYDKEDESKYGECPCGNQCQIGRHHFNQFKLAYFEDGPVQGLSGPQDVMDTVLTEIFTPKFRGYTFIAHYGKGYDFQPIVAWLIERGIEIEDKQRVMKIIKRGEKIQYLEVKGGYNIRFVDSINLIVGTKLSMFPEIFGLDASKYSKGCFPHGFNKPYNWNYVGPWPDKEYYGYSRMPKKDKEEFDKWYDTVKNTEFDFQKEFNTYCEQDVIVLREGCLKFREMFLNLCEIDPFQYFTLAQVCMAEYRAHHLPEDTIGIHINKGSDTYSADSIRWLTSLPDAKDIHHALNGGEYTVDNKYRVDGYNPKTNTVYQYHGCYWHGCNKCYDGKSINKHNGKYMKELNENTQRISNIIKKKHNLVEMWECQLPKETRKRTIKGLIEPPKPRDAFHGGRTEAFKLLYDAKSHKQKMRYIDVVSLYPTVQYYDRFPIGHYKKIMKPELYDPNWFGFIQCTILPPRGLYLPVLPYRQETKQAHKLMFGLCRSCMERINEKCNHFPKYNVKLDLAAKQERKIEKATCFECAKEREKECNHNDEERALTGFWCSNEIQKAIEKGYTIQKIYEVWHFDKSSTELFKSYIRKFMKIKLETSKIHPSKEEEYRRKAREELGIELGEIKYNPGMRFISKICLNSLWGKFGQADKYPKTEYLHNNKELFNILNNAAIEDLQLSFINDKLINATYTDKDEQIKENFNTNIYIACFTTANARMRLYDMMEKLDWRVCYCDTDSVIYIEDEYAKSVVKLGDSLGEFSEDGKLEGGKWIEYFAAGGPKDYGGIIGWDKELKDNVFGKCKGLRINADVEENINLENRIKLIKGILRYVFVRHIMFIIKNYKIHTVEREKMWSFQYNKRIPVKREEDFYDTLPYGY